MKWHYDMCGAEPIIRDLPVYSVGTTSANDILAGAPVARIGAISTAVNHMFIQRADAAVLDEVVGVANETYDTSAQGAGINRDKTNGISATGTGNTNYLKCIINPMAVWLTEWSQHADNDSVNTAADTSGKTITGTFTSPGDDREGDWVYITKTGSTTGGAGNLFQIGAGSTTVYTAVTDYDDNLKGNTTSDTYIVMNTPYTGLVVGGSIDLSTAAGEECTQAKGNDLTGEDTGLAITLQNYIQDKATPLTPLRADTCSGKNYDAATARLFGDLFLTGHMLLAGPGVTGSGMPTIT